MLPGPDWYNGNVKTLIPFFVLLGGIASGTMVATNSRLKETFQSPALTIAVAFLIGSLFMFLVAATGLTGKSDFSKINETPWWAWIGGILSIAAVTIMLVAKESGGGTAFVLAATVVGQQVAALALEHNGWLGTEKSPINGWKIAGFLLLAGGALLMGKK